MRLRLALPLAGLFGLGVAVGLAAGAHAQPGPGRGYSITYDMSDLPLVIQVDPTGTVAIEELPFPGEVVYQPSARTIYYRHPEEEEWLAIPPEELAPQLVPATLAQAGSGKPWQGKPTTQWNVKVGKSTCDQWVGSPSAAKQTGINVADILHILAAVQWLNGGKLHMTCEKIDITPEQAAMVGLPVLFTAPNGRWQLQDVAAEHIPAIAIPKATPLDDGARLRLLLVQFSPEERATLLAKLGNQPLPAQIEAISNLLNQESLP